MSVFINVCRLLSALPPLSQFGRGRLSLVAISFYALSLLFGPCRLSEFTLGGPDIGQILVVEGKQCGAGGVGVGGETTEMWYFF